MMLVSSYRLVDVGRPMIAGNFATEMFYNVNFTTMLIIYHRYACWSMYLYVYSRFCTLLGRYVPVNSGQQIKDQTLIYLRKEKNAVPQFMAAATPR